MAEAVKPKKYVVVLAHADGWGALSANKVVRHLHQHYPDVGVHLIVSQATKKDGKIITKLDDLKTPRELKETNLLKYFEHVDAHYDRLTPQAEIQRQLDNGGPQGMSEGDRFAHFVELGRQHAQQQMADLLTFKQLAKHCCADHTVHYTSKGGPKGGEEAAAIVEALEKQYGHGPEVLLSVDTMAILPGKLLEKYQCFSAHPGPLDTVKIENMQGTLRSLVNQVFYDAQDNRLPAGHGIDTGVSYIKGTLFMQHPELDKGPPIRVVKAPVCIGMSAYQARDEVYDALTDEMLARLPVLLDKDKRAELVAQATREKEQADAQPHERIPELEAEPLARWQGQSVGVPDPSKPWGVEVIQNEIVGPQYFRNQMRRFYPGPGEEFDKTYHAIYGDALKKLATQKQERLQESGDHWARLFSGEPGLTIRQYDPKTGDVIAEYKNPPSRG